MDTLSASAQLLHEFSEPHGLKYLTHDIRSAGVDYVNFVYSSEKTILGMAYGSPVDPELFALVRGFVFGPSWIDAEGREHTGFCSSQEWVSYYERTGAHPMTDPVFAEDIEAFRRSIRIRDGQLRKYFHAFREAYPSLSIKVDPDVVGADFYVNVRRLKAGIDEIIGMMAGYSSEHPVVSVGFDEYEEGGLTVARITITQEGSFPMHTFERDRNRFASGGGNLASIRKAFDGTCRWSIVSRWEGDTAPRRWRILQGGPGGLQPETEFLEGGASGFTHEIEIIYSA